MPAPIYNVTVAMPSEIIVGIYGLWVLFSILVIVQITDLVKTWPKRKGRGK